MADEADEFFNSGTRIGVPQAGVGGGQSNLPSVPTPDAQDEADAFFAPPPPPAPSATPSAAPSPTPAAQTAPAGDEADQFFAGQSEEAPMVGGDEADQFFAQEGVPQVAPQTVPVDYSNRPGYVQLFMSGVERGVGQVKQMVPAAQGLVAEAQGDEEAKAQALAEVRRIEHESPAPQFTLSDIHNVEDFTYWATEKFGEQAPIFGSMLLTGGTSGLVAGLVGRGFLLREASRQALIRSGQLAGGYAAGAGLETSGIATELAQATGDFRPDLAVPFGAAAGALEMWMPVKLLRELPTAGVAAGFAKAAGREAATEFGQEVLAGTARDLADPNYSFFSKEMALRLAEATAAGAVVGGGVGGAAHAGAKVFGAKEGDQGEDVPLSEEELKKLRAPDPEPSPVQPGPVSWLREKFMQKTELSPDSYPADPEAVDDVLESRTISSPVKRAWRKAGMKEKQYIQIANFIDDVTPKYAILDSGGNAGNRVYTSTELEEALASRPNEQFAPRIVKVDPTSMQPGALTANLFDLPDADSSKVYFAGRRMFFLPGVPKAQQQQLLQRYHQLVDRLVSRPWQLQVRNEDVTRQIAEMQAEYEQLVNDGLRVIPSPGAGFNYSGVVDGEAVNEVPQSGRSWQVARLNDEGEYDVFGAGTPPNYTTMSDEEVSRWVAIDFNKVDKDQIVYLEGSKEIPLNKKSLNAPNKIGWLQLKVKGKPLKRGALIAGIVKPEFTTRTSDVMSYTARDWDKPMFQRGTGQVKAVVRFQSPETRKIVEKLQSLLEDLNPVLMNLYRRLGVVNPPDIILHDDGIASAADITNNRILLSVLSFTERHRDQLHATSDIRTSMLITLMHEIGHLVTLRSWGKLPAALKEQAEIEYQRAILKYRVQGTTAHLGLPLGTLTSTDRQTDYNLTFIEYLAETFRRWSFSDARFLTDLELFYGEMGSKLAILKKEAADTIGQDQAEDLYRAGFAFNQVMEYLDSAVQGGLRPVQMMAKGFSVGDYPTPTEIASARAVIEQELVRFRQLLTADMQTEIGNEVNYTQRGNTLWVRFGSMDDTTRTIRILAGSLALTGDVDQLKRVVAHEIFHGVQDELTKEEAQVLVEAGRRQKVLSPTELRNILRDVNDWMDQSGLVFTEAEKTEVRRYVVENEYMAVMVDMRANGFQFESLIGKILDRILETVSRIVNGVKGLGWQSHQDIIRAFYRGEYTRRYDAKRKAESLAQLYDHASMRSQSATVWGPTLPMEDVEVVPLDSNNVVHLSEVKDEAGQVKLGVYILKSPEGEEKGFVEISHDSLRGYGVDTTFVHRKFYREGVPMKLYVWLRDRYGEEPKPTGRLTQAGYRALRKINPMLVQHYVYNPRGDMWYSPNVLAQEAQNWQARVRRDERLKLEPDILKFDKQVLEELQTLLSKVQVHVKPTEYMGREFELRTTGQAREAEDAKLVEAVTGEQIGNVPDQFETLREETERKEIAKAAKALGVAPEMAAASQADTLMVHNVLTGYLNQMLGRTGQRDPQTDSYLTGTPSDDRTVNGIIYEADRISWFSKVFFGLHQVAWRNEHLPWMRQLLSLAEQMNTKIMQWVSRADDVARRWDGLSERQRNALSEYMFWLTEMDYLSPQERAQHVVRHPTPQERQQYIAQNRLGAETVAVGIAAEQEFADFLTETERISVQKAQQTFANNPQGLQAELSKIAQEMAALRAKPYFPMTRFGQYTVTVRDPQDQSVQAFYTFPTVRERDAGVRQVARQWAVSDISVGVVPEEVQEFMGLPAPLLRMIKAQLPGMTPQQSQWFDQLSAVMAPERSFRKRWLARKGTPGYSLDGIRVFSAYFRSGARYLGRIEYKDQMQQQIDALRSSARTLRDSTKRYMLSDYAQQWLNYVMEGGRDWGKLKSVISIFQLGGSVAAAGMNLTQVPLATYPYLAGLFGDGVTLKALQRTADVLRPIAGLPARGTPDYLSAREEAVAQGKIEAGQAIDLGAFAEYDNLSRTFAGTAAQRVWRQIGYWSMVMFSRSEQWNREWTFKAAYELALKDIHNPHVQNIASTYATEILDLAARRNLTTEQATAFIVARRAIDQTQLVFQPWARPTFLRGGFASTLQIFFSYTQGMLYLLGNSPGAKRMWFGLLAMYGLAGLPGSEDLDRLIRLLARKFMGKDFSPQLEARKMIREMTRGTALDQVGPDIALHGISRYSLFGIGMLPEGWGVPRFDASANGSMGQLIPGLSEALRGAANNAKWTDITADVARDVSGAGFGQLFALMQFATSPPMSPELKKWEKVFPRSIKAASKAYRYATEGQEVTNQGGTLARFDMSDPDDVATVVAQAIGFTPEKVAEKWRAIRATQDIALWYESRKATLYAQLDVAIRNAQVEDQRSVINGMRELNSELAKQGYGAMGIKVQAVVSSLRNRARTRAMQSNDLPAKTSQIPLTRQMLDLYPGVLQEIERKKVK